jgi:molybdopterin molybdotransferase
VAYTAAVPRTLSYAEARARVLGAVRVLPSDLVPLAEARGRALRRAFRAPHALPPFRNSAMDGYAIRSQDLAEASDASPVGLPVVGVIAAGAVPAPLGPREAMRIMTGAALPGGADAVVPFEEALTSPDRLRVRFKSPVAPNAFVRGEGEDLPAGAEALPAGRDLSAHDLALLASLGAAKVEVGLRPRVAILSTGDELLGVEEPLRPGTVRDSNTPLLRSLLEECQCIVVRSERVSDRPDAVQARLRALLEVADVVLTIGGVSAGDFDPVKEGLAGIPGAELWRVAMKPGRPQAFGSPNGRIFHGLPGNPASVACVFEALVRPALRKMQGFTTLDRPRLQVRVAESIDSRAGRTDFVRATLSWRDDAWWAQPAGAQVSGHVLPQSRAHALVIVPHAAAALAAGDRAEALLLRWPDHPAE